jgi:hypothetical protein
LYKYEPHIPHLFIVSPPLNYFFTVRDNPYFTVCGIVPVGSWRQEEGEERRQEMDICKQESTEGMEREETPEGNARHTCFSNKALYERTIPIKLKPLQKCRNHPSLKFKSNGRQNLSMAWEAFGKLVALISDLCDNLRVHVPTCGNVYLCSYVP